MAKPSIRKRVGKRYTAPEFRPYVTALGQLSLAWNDLQECFGALFWTLMSPPPLETAFAHREALFVWYSIKSDRSQREMLKAAANNLTIDWHQPALVDEINWTINKADRLEDWRNDAVHSPLFLNRAEGLARGIPRGIRPASWQFNPRAIKLEKRQDLLNEFKFCRDFAIALADYTHLIDIALINPHRPWPDRPILPNRRP
jgi:hypothetical protein